VTIDEYNIFCQATGRVIPIPFSRDGSWESDKNRDSFINSYCPVVNVSWHDAKAFADWMGCRLPTEAEWEYACRAGTHTLFNTGNNITSFQANIRNSNPFRQSLNAQWIEGSRRRTIPVGCFEPNNWGLYDMHGNVWEWCNDWHAPYSDDNLLINPIGPPYGSTRVCRGGSWNDDMLSCSSSMRNHGDPACFGNDLGFRLVLDVNKIQK